MGLYYNPLPPHIGAQQPLEQRKLTPPSGPLPQNPPFIGGIAQAIILGWSAFVATNAIAPVTARNLTPSGTIAATPYNPARYDIYRSWDAPAPPTQFSVNLNPPIAGPTPQNPPILGSRVPLCVQVAWIPPPPFPIVAINLDPPINGPVVNNPPFTGARIPLEVQINWPLPLVVVQLTISPVQSAPASLVPYIRGNVDILNAWLPPVPAPIVAVNLDPPISGPTPQNPPVIGSRVPLAVQIGWLPPTPSPIVAVNLNPPVSGPLPFFPYIGSVIPLPVHISWLPPAPAPIVGPKFTKGAVAASNPPFMGGARVRSEVLINWLAPAPAPIVGTNLTNGVPGSTLTLSATENPDIVSFTATFRPVWVVSIKQDETWTGATKQDETWTPAIKQDETWN